MKLVGYEPPKIQSVIRTILETRNSGISIYTGLWNEGLAEEERDYTARENYDKKLRDYIKEFNRTQDFSVLAEAMAGIKTKLDFDEA